MLFSNDMHDALSIAPTATPSRPDAVLPDLNWNLHRLRIFLVVARNGSFTRAAQELHIAQPAVSHQVKALERDLGVELFERGGRRIGLTPAGEVLATSCRDVFSRLDESAQALAEIATGTGGMVTLAADSTSGVFVVPRALGAFHRLYPAIDITLRVDNRAGVIRRLRDWECDLAVMASPPAELGCEVEPFLADRLVVVAPPDHPLAGQVRVNPRQLTHERFLLREPGSGTREATARFFARRGLPLSVGMELGSGEAIIQAVSAGLGVSVISRWAIELELRAGRLVILPVEGFPIERSWSIVRLRERRLTAVVRTCREYLVQYAQSSEQA